MAEERSRTRTFVILGAAFALAAALVYAAFAQDAHDSTSAPAPSAVMDAGDLLPRVSVLGSARVLPSSAEPRVELTFSLNPDLMPDDLGIISLTSPFVIGQMRTGTSREKMDADLTRISIHHHILPAVAWFQGEAARRNRAWLGALMQWELDVTQRELLALYPDASVPEGGLPKPPALTIIGSVLKYSRAVTQIPELGTDAAKKFLCMGETVCDDSVLSGVLVIVVE